MSFSAAPTESFDVIVVGGGPAKSQLVHEVAPAKASAGLARRQQA